METLIKRYGNRKLYDTEISSYVTLDDVYDRVQRGHSVKVMDYADEVAVDITEETLFRAIVGKATKPENNQLRNLIVSAIKPNKTGEVK